VIDDRLIITFDQKKKKKDCHLYFMYVTLPLFFIFEILICNSNVLFYITRILLYILSIHTKLIKTIILYKISIRLHIMCLQSYSISE
jgi:hypothetical protein